MSKAFKYTNENYIESSGIVHDRELLSEILDNLTEIGSNSNGNYIKFSNGILICYGEIAISTISSQLEEVKDTVYLPYNYVNSNYNVLATLTENDPYWASLNNVSSNRKTNSFDINTRYVDGVPPIVLSNFKANWITIGKWK